MTEHTRDLEPGEICALHSKGLQTIGKAEGPSGRKRRHCSFLWGYFSSPDSIIEEIPVNLPRERSAAEIAKIDLEEGLINFDSGDIVVVPVPDSGKPYAEGYAKFMVTHEKPVWYSEGLLKYQHSWKSYLRGTQTQRDVEANHKLNVIENRVKGKKVILCEDSIRRGTQLGRGPIKFLKEAEVDEIHLRVGTPRNTKYCRFDERDKKDDTLIANQFTTDDEVADFYGVDSVRFISEDGFVRALTEGTDLTGDDFCLGCYEGNFDFLGDDALKQLSEI
jgi:amidophosphoribosyltransferase